MMISEFSLESYKYIIIIITISDKYSISFIYYNDCCSPIINYAKRERGRGEPEVVNLSTTRSRSTIPHRMIILTVLHK